MLKKWFKKLKEDWNEENKKMKNPDSSWNDGGKEKPGICRSCSAQIPLYVELCSKCSSEKKKGLLESFGFGSKHPFSFGPAGGQGFFIALVFGALLAVIAIINSIYDSMTPDPPPLVHIAVSVDWEGRDIAEENLQAFADFRAAHPEVPLTHFLNAAYFTKPDADGGEVTEKIQRALDPIDELGLHIHPWKSLVEASGITFRAEPTIWGKGRRSQPSGDDIGHDISVEAYETDEFQAIVKKSKDILAKHGFKLGKSFRAGAWLAGPRVREAIRREGFTVDSSATDTKWHGRIAQYDLPAMIR
ncbi:MAG TPA: hypothetical protein DDW23_07775, partial [Planctomycetes bacterium]|nr:hypothetical protein [Planctomycetota bacterium]